MCLSFFFEGVGGVSKKEYKRECSLRGRERVSSGTQEGFLRRGSKRVSKKGPKIGKIAKGVLQKYSPHGLVSRHRGGVLPSLRTHDPHAFPLSKFAGLHHLRNYRNFLKSGDKRRGKDTQGREGTSTL